MSEASNTPEVKVTVKKESKPKQGLAADAANAKAQHQKEDAASAAQHQDLRDNDKIVEQTPIRGYEAARENMYLPESEKVEPDMPETPALTGQGDVNKTE